MTPNTTEAQGLSRSDLEHKLAQLDKTVLLNADERLQMPFLKAMVAKGDPGETAVAASAVRALLELVDERKRRRVAATDAPAVSGAAESLEGQRRGALQVVRALLAAVGVILVIGCGGGLALGIQALNPDNAAFALAGGPILALWVFLSVFLISTVARLFQLAREWAEKMDVRSVSIRFLSEAIAHYEATGDPALLDRAIAMLPPANTNVDAQPLDQRDLRVGLRSLVRLAAVSTNDSGRSREDQSEATAASAPTTNQTRSAG